VSTGHRAALLRRRGQHRVRGPYREAVRPVSCAGVVGHNLRKVLPFCYRLCPGDVIVLLSDGVSCRFDLGDYVQLPAPSMAEAIVCDHGKEHDDASCMVVRFRGAAGPVIAEKWVQIPEP